MWSYSHYSVSRLGAVQKQKKTFKVSKTLKVSWCTLCNRETLYSFLILEIRFFPKNRISLSGIKIGWKINKRTFRTPSKEWGFNNFRKSWAKPDRFQKPVRFSFGYYWILIPKDYFLVPKWNLGKKLCSAKPVKKNW